MCKYADKCPSMTAICTIEEPSGECVPFILAAYEKLKAGETTTFRKGNIEITVPNR